MTRTVVEGSREDQAAAAAAAAKKPKTNLDAVLSGLEEAKNISTVTKSHLDWDNYKVRVLANCCNTTLNMTTLRVTLLGERMAVCAVLWD
jgi:Bucentaur or craniofacial development